MPVPLGVNYSCCWRLFLFAVISRRNRQLADIYVVVLQLLQHVLYCRFIRLFASKRHINTHWKQITLVNTQNVSETQIVCSSSIRRAETKNGLRIQFLALVFMIHEMRINAQNSYLGNDSCVNTVLPTAGSWYLLSGHTSTVPGSEVAVGDGLLSTKRPTIICIKKEVGLTNCKLKLVICLKWVTFPTLCHETV